VAQDETKIGHALDSPRGGVDMAGTISVVIPTWCEGHEIAEAVACARRVGDEVIVADGGSPDGTARIAEEAGARVVHAPKGRGAQLDAGARAATGDVLLFLHADARLPEAAREAIIDALRSPDVQGGNFFVRFEPATRAARLFTWANHVRREWLSIYYGDSAPFVRRSVYIALGGFKPLPIFEDYELVRRLERRGLTAYVRDVEVRVSARRFQQAPLRTLGIWTMLQTLYSVGVSAHRLARFY
jgi:rSAM/selenodomain-associated transferase 2